MSILTCPHCKKTFEITDAFKHELQEEILAQERKKYEKELSEAKKKAAEDVAGELKAYQEEIAKKDAALKRAQEEELRLRKQKNQLEDDKRSFELEKQRQLDAEREKIRQKALEESAEQFHLKEKEQAVVIEQLKKALEDAQRKAAQGSQQLQGEVQELDLEQLLHETFPQDSIEPIGKGVLGADIRQTVRSKLGTECGIILWESKRTKAWSDGWLAKLKDDMRKDKAHIAAIVSEAVPQDLREGIGIKDGVYVAMPKLAMILAGFLRERLLAVAKQKKIAENTQTKAESLYAYVTSHEFQHQVEAMIEIYFDMQAQIARERAAQERSWKLREMQITKLISGVSGIYGSMQGSAGRALPSIKGLDQDGDAAPESEDGQTKLIE